MPIKNQLDKIAYEIVISSDPIDGGRYDTLSMLYKFFRLCRNTTVTLNITKDDITNEDY